MKRMIPALLLLALTVACVKQPAAPSVSVGRTESFPTVPSIVETPIGSDEVPLQPIETIASSPVPATDNPTSAPEPDPTEPPAPAIDYTTYRSVPLDAPLSYPIEESYAQRWLQDWMELYVSDGGVGYVGWFDPNEFVTEANGNVVLMPFDEIQNRIRDDLNYSYAWSDESNRGISELHVKKIVLSCAIVRIPNDPDEAALVPAWVVVYNDSRSEKVKGHEKLMLINAIDGSYLHVGA